MSVLRNKLKDRFVQVPNELVTDNRISIPARLVYVYLASKPDGWKVLNDDVKKSLGIKDDSTLARYWKELINAGWVTRKKCLPGENAGTYEYYLEDVPKTGNLPNMENSQKWDVSKDGKNPDYNNTDTFSNNEDLSNTENNPYIPPKKETSILIISELVQRINKLFHRRESTAWSPYEERKLKEVAKRSDVLDEMGEIEKLYNSDYPYRRRDISTFLNQWTTELDRARNYKPQQSKFDRTTREVADYDPGF